MHSVIGIDIAAPPDVVYRIARDVTRWTQLLPHYSSSRVVRAEPDGVLVCDFVARRPLLPVLGIGLPVAWRSRTWHDPATRRLRFVHVAGATRGMDVTWTIEAAPGGTRVEIGHDFRRALPLVGGLLGDEAFPAFVDRWFTRPIAGRTLATIKALAEALAPEGSNP
jgi:ribosome-associated toxin RatA of RatAB toxin-antitoxin module